MKQAYREKIKYLQKNLLSWFHLHKRQFPWRKSKLNNYTKVISELLLQRTKAATVSIFLPVFIKKFPNWQSIVNVKEEYLSNFLKPLGLYQQRSKRIIQLSFEMVKRKGKFPKDKEILENIPGIGQYIANAIMLFVHNKPFPLLDINMTRLLERYFKPRKLSDIRDDPYLQQLSKEVVKHTKVKELNWAIIDYAALICKIINPLCQECVINKMCTLFNS